MLVRIADFVLNQIKNHVKEKTEWTYYKPADGFAVNLDYSNGYPVSPYSSTVSYTIMVLVVVCVTQFLNSILLIIMERSFLDISY